ncbi:hypothetical protein [Akkermansia massiliensis]
MMNNPVFLLALSNAKENKTDLESGRFSWQGQPGFPGCFHIPCSGGLLNFPCLGIWMQAFHPERILISAKFLIIKMMKKIDLSVLVIRS